MKRYLGAFGAAALVFAAVLGSAAALDVGDAGVVQYGKSMDVSCDEDGVTVEGYFLETNGSGDAPAQSTSRGVVISDVSTNCQGKTMVASALGGGGGILATGSSEISRNTVRITYDDGDLIPAKNIEGVQLTIG